MKNRILSMLLIMLLVVSLTACKKDKNNENTGDNTPVVENPIESNPADNTNEPTVEPTDEPTSEPTEEPTEAELLIAAASAYIPSTVNLTDYSKMDNEVRYAQFIIPNSMTDYISVADRVILLEERENLNPKKSADKERMAEIDIYLDKTIRAHDKSSVTFTDTKSTTSNTVDKRIKVTVMANNTGYSNSDLTAGIIKKLLGKMDIDGGTFEITEIPYKSNNKVIAELTITAADGTVFKGYSAIALNSEVIGMMLTYQDMFNPDRDWMVYCTKSLTIGR